jgi:uncharacterized phage protein gp47/JayE
MPNQVTITGLEIKTVAEIIADLTTGMQTIYGSDINVSQNSPDGQLINIFAQAAEDNLELLLDVYNSFSVELAYGTVLDQRVALNGLARIQGTYTITDVTVVVDRALTITGLDALDSDPTAVVFTVADGEGNQFYLQTTHVFSVAGSAALAFRAVTIGQVETTQNTITNQVTTVLGVTSVNNPSVATSTGINEETDAQLKVRHAEMFKLAAYGPADAVRAAMLSVDGVSDAYVIENATSGTVNSVPRNSIWPIVNGGTDADVAAAIYAKKAPGCGMYGGTTVAVVRPQGNSINIKFDRAISEDLYIQFSLIAVYTGAAWDEDDIKTQLVEMLTYRLNQAATIGDVVRALQAIVPQAYAVSVGVSDDGMSYLDNINPTSAKYYFVLDVARIDIV